MIRSKLNRIGSEAVDQERKDNGVHRINGVAKQTPDIVIQIGEKKIVQLLVISSSTKTAADFLCLQHFVGEHPDLTACSSWFWAC